MAEVVVFSLMEKIAAAVAATEARFSRSSTSKPPLQDIQLRMTRINRELEAMKEFLKHANSYQGENQQRLLVLAEHVQDVALDIEDIVDEYTYVIAGGSWGGARAYIFATFNHSKSTALHNISEKLEAAEARLLEISRTKDSFGITIPQRNPNPNEEQEITYHLAEPSQLMEEDLVGIADHKRNLVKLLTDDDSRRLAVAVYGVGGVGKTTLVTRVYKDQKMAGHFGSCAWVTVSQSYRVDDLLRKILKELYREKMEEVAYDFDSTDYRGLVETLRWHLGRKRYLIVLDDVWEANVWTEISYALLANNRGSRVVITTRIREVTSVAAADRIVRLGPLPEETAWDLFCRKAFPWEEGNGCPQELKPWAAKMVQQCEGLPLAIVSIGNLLSHKERAEATWRNMYESLTSSAKENAGLHQVSKILSLSIRNLPYHLRNCLLHCSLFPEDYPIARNRLIRLWVAEGFVKARTERSMEEVAEDYLNQLVSRFLLQVTDVNESGRVRFCRVHDLVRELIVWRSKDERFAEVYDGRPEALSDRIRRLSLTKEGQSEILSTNVALLRSFHAFSPVSDALISKCRLLRVLDLSSAPVQTLPDEIGHLFNLHYFSVRQTKVQNLPKSLGNLKKLETLDAVYTLVEDLPAGIAKLENLRHLMVKKFHRQTSRYTILGEGVKVAGGIGNLKLLQTLKAVVADETMIRQLGKLTQLKSLDIRGVRTINSVDLSTSISKLDRLLRLVVMARYRDDTLLLGNLTPPPQLRKLSLYGKLDKGMLPQWFTSLRTLTHLVLKMSRLKEDSLNSLMAMPNLVSLFLMQAYDGSKLRFRAGWHRKLKTLGLCDMIHLDCIEIEENALESLVEMTLVRCGELKTIPVGIEKLRRLQKLELEGMPIELVQKLQEGGGTEEDRRRLEHIPIINNWSQRDGIWIEERLACGHLD